MSLVMLVAVQVKGTRSPMPQNMVYDWTQILRYGANLSVARLIFLTWKSLTADVVSAEVLSWTHTTISTFERTSSTW